jgi:Mor family transcriptional regulator
MTTQAELMRNDFFQTIMATAIAGGTDFGMDSSIAEQFACNLVNAIAKDFGGQNLTVPKDFYFALSKRDLEIYKKFSGSNYHVLAREYNLSTRRIRTICETMGQRDLAKRQPRLFEDKNE